MTNQIHLTIGVYADKSYKWNGVPTEFLADHIEYNKNARWGRALIVDWEVIHNGYLTDKELQEFIAKHKPNWEMPTIDTAPYV